LAAVADGQKSGHVIEWRPEIVTLPQLCGSTVECHPNENAVRFWPSFRIERELGGKRSMYSIPRVVEGCTESIASGLENVAALCVNAFAQYLVMSGERYPHRIMICFPQSRAALNVGE
jgi:hypothetical protein